MSFSLKEVIEFKPIRRYQTLRIRLSSKNHCLLNTSSLKFKEEGTQRELGVYQDTLIGSSYVTTHITTNRIAVILLLLEIDGVRSVAWCLNCETFTRPSDSREKEISIIF